MYMENPNRLMQGAKYREPNYEGRLSRICEELLAENHKSHKLFRMAFLPQLFVCLTGLGSYFRHSTYLKRTTLKGLIGNAMAVSVTLLTTI